MFINIAMFSNARTPVQAYLSRMSDTDSVIRAHITTLINGLITDGIWDKLAYLGVIQNLESDSLLCLKRETGTFAFVDCTYLANNYIKPNAAGYIDSNFDPEIDSTIVNKDSFSFSSYLNTITTVDGNAYGRWDATNIVRYLAQANGSNSFFWHINSLNISEPSATRGLWLGSSSATDSYIYSGGVNNSSSGANNGLFTWSTSISGDRSVYHGAANIGGTVSTVMQDEVMAWHGGSYLTPAEVANFRTRIETYLTARGAI